MSITETNITYIAGTYGYITEAGDWSAGTDMLLLDPLLLTPKQWENVGELHADDRSDYILAIFHGDTVNTAAIEKDNEL